MSTTTTRYGIHLPVADGSELVNVAADVIGPLSTIDAELGIPVTTALPSNPASGKTVAVSTAGPVYRSYFHNGTAPASAGWVELLNSSGTFGSTVKVSTADGSSAATLATAVDGTASTPVLMINPSSTSKRALDIRLAGDPSSRLRVDMSAGMGSGTLIFGDGTASDVNLYRSAANELKTDDSLVVGLTLRHLGSSLGFYNAAAITKPAVTGARGSNAALTSLLTALANLGLITNSTTT